MAVRQFVGRLQFQLSMEDVSKNYTLEFEMDRVTFVPTIPVWEC